MSESPRVSICVPTVSRPQLVETVYSVLGQSYPNLELVISDNDGRLEPEIRAIPDDRIQYFRNDRNYGMAGNFNLCLRRARGNLIGLVMDDDLLLPQFVEKVLDRFDADPTIDVVFTNHLFDDGHNRYPRSLPLRSGRYDKFLPELLRYQPLALSAAVMRRRVWDQLGSLPDLWTADLFISLKAAQAGSAFAYIDEPLMVYRLHPGQLSSDRVRFREDNVVVWRMFRFDDPACDAIRRDHLAQSLASLAASRIETAEYADACRLAAEAIGLRASGLSWRERTILTLAQHPLAARLCRWAWLRRHPTASPAAEAGTAVSVAVNS